MTDTVTDSDKIMQLIRQMENLYQQVSALLTTADGQMGDADWKTFNSYAISEASKAIYSPSDWFPKQAYRFYQNPQSHHLLAFVSVLLQVREGAPISEPLIVAGIFDYGPAQSIEHWDYWFARLHLTIPGRRDDGEIVTVVSNDFPPQWTKWKVPFQRAATLAVPLLSVRNADDLRTRIISPLLNVLGDAVGAVP